MEPEQDAPTPPFTLKELAEKAKEYNYEAADDTLFNNPSALDDFLHRLEGFHPAITELEHWGKDTPFSLEKKLAIAEALSLSAAISLFLVRVRRLLRSTTPRDVAEDQFMHYSIILRNAFMRYRVLADGID